MRRLLLAALLVSPAAQAATSVQYVNCAAGEDTADGESWETAKRTLQAAVDTGYEEVRIGPGFCSGLTFIQGGEISYRCRPGSDRHQRHDRLLVGRQGTVAVSFRLERRGSGRSAGWGLVHGTGVRTGSRARIRRSPPRGPIHCSSGLLFWGPFFWIAGAAPRPQSEKDGLRVSDSTFLAGDPEEAVVVVGCFSSDGHCRSVELGRNFFFGIPEITLVAIGEGPGDPDPRMVVNFHHNHFLVDPTVVVQGANVLVTGNSPDYLEATP